MSNIEQQLQDAVMQLKAAVAAKNDEIVKKIEDLQAQIANGVNPNTLTDELELLKGVITDVTHIGDIPAPAPTDTPATDTPTTDGQSTDAPPADPAGDTPAENA